MKRARQMVTVGLAVALAAPAPAQQLSNLDRDRARGMLEAIAADVRKHYYDPELHGVDWEAKVRETREKIDKATSLGMAFSYIAAALDAFNDSHTFFLAPRRAYRHDYGWRHQMIGDRCYVTRVRPGSDAEAKGLKPGDEVLAINGYVPTRENLWKMQYVFHILRPQTGLQLDVRKLDGNETQLDVMAKVLPLKQVVDVAQDFSDMIREAEGQGNMMRARGIEMGDDLMILKIPQFRYSQSVVYEIIRNARHRKALILDLRGNPGGSVETLDELLGGMFEHDVKIGDRVGRKTMKPQVAKPKAGDVFTGKLVVLVDSKSASASEVFARVVQLEKRGTVLGDRTAGAVMEAKHYHYSFGVEPMVFYGASITDSDLVMSDGKSLEKTGVTPDETLLPTAEDLARQRDPVMARAAALLGVNLDAGKAGKLFPFEWPKE